jgi:hypothetical protein
MAGGAGKLPKWQIVLADPIGWQEWLQPAKMAESGRKLPKWQASANIVPNTMPNWHSKYRAKQNLFSPNFFRLLLPISNV